MKKILAFVVVSAMLLSMVASLVFIGAADKVEDQNSSFFVTKPKYDGVKNIPILGIVASFDADGDGENDYDPNDTDKLYSDVTQEYYGEQWAITKPKDHYDMFFKEGHSVRDYYLELTDGIINFIPCAFEKVEPEWGTTDGILAVTVPIKHPTASGDASGTITAIVDATDEYVNYAQYDTNGDGMLTTDEIVIVIFNAGVDHAYTGSYYNSGSPSAYFAVHSTSQGFITMCDDVLLTYSGHGNVSNVGEYAKFGTFITLGVLTHEIAHNFGAEDLYDRNNGGGGSAISSWPRAGYFSLQCMGNNNGNGNYPCYEDPYHRVYLGWADEVTVNGDGSKEVKNLEVTLNSTLSGAYQVVRVNTPDPREFFYIEIRLKEGYDQKLPTDTSGGILIWHIDQGICSKYFASGMASSSYISAGDKDRHDSGIVPLFRPDAWNPIGTLIVDQQPSDPYYYLSDDASTSVFDSCFYHGYVGGGTSLNSYPDDYGYEGAFNLHVEVLSAPGSSMKISISTQFDMVIPPLSSVSAGEATYNSLTLFGKVITANGFDITDSGFVIATKEDLSDGKVISANVVDKEFSTVVEGLNEDSKYYIQSFVTTKAGKGTSPVSTVYTAKKPVEKTYSLYKLYKNNGSTRPSEVKINLGETLHYSFPMTYAGFVFAGWYWDKKFIEPFDMNYVSEEYEEISLYARWIKEDEVCKLKVVGAEIECDVYPVAIGETFYVPTAVEKDGYTFEGWYKDSALTERFDFTVPTTESGTVTIYAKYVINSGEQTTEADVTTVETETDKVTDTDETKEETEPSRIWLWIIIGAVAVAGVVVGIIVIEKNKKK
ncbi:MAG: InlB B-repeat-containing protein [Clostridiales bacterium]|nr:InlB B-repeat-containing protein [Clostridiales bacterium]